MMSNKWMQTGIFFGVALGMFVGAFLSVISPLVPFGIAYVFMFLCMWWAGDSRGTDGWGGPWIGPQGKTQTKRGSDV